MNNNILLVEPAYKSKYPPLGLMKISTYHKENRNDNVTFVRGLAPDSMYWQDWDRIYISTLFTYNWKETVKTIRYYRETFTQCPPENIFVGGILATLMPEELHKATGIYPVTGLLTDPRKIRIDDDDTNIDMLVPDYSILKGIGYNHETDYLGYATRGCKNQCKFCAVKKLEPEFKHYHASIKEMVEGIKNKHGEKNNLILMDNNVLASDQFDRIIQDIVDAGFADGARQPNSKKRRTVDFNQGLDARCLTDHKMKMLRRIPLEPMRVAFDSYAYKDIYETAMRLANKHGQKLLSNYILYNYFDQETGRGDNPEDFYKRLKLNIDLNEEFKTTPHRTSIYSFPMKFIPLNAIDANMEDTVIAVGWQALSENIKSKTRRELTANNPNWNQRYLRGMQVILNVVHGAVMPGKEFFEAAFGRDEHEFVGFLLMPDGFIQNRMKPNWKNKKLPLEKKWTKNVSAWMSLFGQLNQQEIEELVATLGSNDLNTIIELSETVKSQKVMKLTIMFIKESNSRRKIPLEKKTIDADHVSEAQIDWIEKKQPRVKSKKAKKSKLVIAIKKISKSKSLVRKAKKKAMVRTSRKKR